MNPPASTIVCPQCSKAYRLTREISRAVRARCRRCGCEFEICPNDLRPASDQRTQEQDPAASPEANKINQARAETKKPKTDPWALLVAFLKIAGFGTLGCTALWIFGFEAIARLFFILTILVLLFLFAVVVITAVEDTHLRMTISGKLDYPIFLGALMWWIPIAIILAPGIVLAWTVDEMMDQGVRFIEFRAHAGIEASSEVLSERIAILDSRSYSWWWPPDYVREFFDSHMRSKLQLVQNEGIPGFSWIARGFFSILYALLRFLQLLGLGTVLLLLLQSYLHIVGRYWLWKIGDLAFTPATSTVAGGGSQ